MSLNGSGVYSPNIAGQPVVAGTVISATVFNALMNDMATALSTALYKDGQQTVTANIPMSGFKFTGLGLGTSTTDAARMDNANVLNMCEFRLTLTTGTPVTTSDVTGATTVYASPYKGNSIALYDGTNWVKRTSAEMSIAIPVAALTMYDVFCYDNSGTPTLELAAWTNTTTRATALVMQNGVLCKTGALTRRYLGSFLTTAVAGQTSDSLTNRLVWNYYNRVRRPMRVLEATDSWTYTTATLRQANAATTNQLNFVIGVSEDAVSANVQVVAANSGSTTYLVAVGLDSITAKATGCVNSFTTASSAGVSQTLTASVTTFPGVGFHYLSWLEYSTASGTTTWYGDNANSGLFQSGIYGELLA